MISRLKLEGILHAILPIASEQWHTLLASEPCQTSKIERFAKILVVNYFRKKLFILDV